jgi:hydroxyacylglutathione hydrolase
MKDMPAAPPYFARMKRLNVAGPPVLGPRGKWPGRVALSPQEVAELVDLAKSPREGNVIIVDVRAKEAFAAAHIGGSLNIPLDNNLPTWAGWVVPADRKVLLVLNDVGELDTVLTHLIRVGFDNIVGYLDGGLPAWENSGLPTDSLEVISAPVLALRLKNEPPPMVLDVRTPGEWESGHIEGARLIHAGLLEGRLDELPRDRPVAVMCGSGHRASIAASLLKRHGFKDVANVAGGMMAWNASQK